jgi:hypothetical protein
LRRDASTEDERVSVNDDPFEGNEEYAGPATVVLKKGKKDRRRIRLYWQAVRKNKKEKMSATLKQKRGKVSQARRVAANIVKGSAETEVPLVQEQKWSETRKRKQAQEPKSSVMAAKQLEPSKQQIYAESEPKPTKKKKLGKRKVSIKSAKNLKPYHFPAQGTLTDMAQSYPYNHMIIVHYLIICSNISKLTMKVKL